VDNCCPFCGYEGEVLTKEYTNKTYSIQCPKCWATGPISEFENLAWEGWKHRHGKGVIWSVDEKLPDKKGNYLVILATNEWNWKTFDGERFVLCDVIKWVDLPEITE